MLMLLYVHARSLRKNLCCRSNLLLHLLSQMECFTDTKTKKLTSFSTRDVYDFRRSRSYNILDLKYEKKAIRNKLANAKSLFKPSITLL